MRVGRGCTPDEARGNTEAAPIAGDRTRMRTRATGRRAHRRRTVPWNPLGQRRRWRTHAADHTAGAFLPLPPRAREGRDAAEFHRAATPASRSAMRSVVRKRAGSSGSQRQGACLTVE
eukprot:5784095-Pleurochrysis_carterae.AAC.4